MARLPRLADFSRMPGVSQLPFGTDQDVGILVERYALRMFFSFQFDFDIIEIGKHQLARSHPPEPARVPDLEQALLRMRVQNAVTLFPAKLDGRIERSARPGRRFGPHCGPPAARAWRNRQSSEFACSRPARVHVADQMGGGKIIAVELLFERAMLFAHIDRAADRDHARHLFHRAHDADRHGSCAPGLHRRQVSANDRASAAAGRTIRRNARPAKTRAAPARADLPW